MGRILSNALVNFAFSILVLILVFRKSRVILNKEYLKYGLSISTPLIIHGIALNILSQSDRMMITWLADASQTGIYSLIYNFSMIAPIVACILAPITISNPDIYVLASIGLENLGDNIISGYSSFNYLKRFIVDTLKIDISLIRGIDKTQEDYAIAKAIINMSNDLGLSVVAEGVESESQLSVLRNLKCDVVQGYYYEKPMKVDELEKKYFIHQALLNSPN